MPNYTAFLSNFIGGGESFTQTPGGGRVRNRIDLRLSRKQVTLLQQPQVVTQPTSEFTGRFVHTTDVIVHDVPQQQVPSAHRIAADIASLLSLASMSKVTAFGHEYPSGSGQSSLQANYGYAMYFRPAIETRDGAVTRRFLESTWTQFRRLKRRRKLPELLEYIAISEFPAQPIEVKLATAFIALENLKDTYARASHIPYIAGSFRRISNPPRANPRNEPRYSFQQLLEQMLLEQGMRRGLRRIIGLRNQIIHSGLPRRPFRSKFKTYCNTHDIIREYLLRLLGYEGQYLAFSNPTAFKTL